MSNIGDMLVDAKGLKYVHDSIKNTFSTKQELTNVDSKFSEVNSARQSGNGTTYNNLKARLDADKAESDAEIAAINESLDDVKADLGDTRSIKASKTDFAKITYQFSESGYMLYNTGVLSQSDKAQNSGFIPVSAGDKFDIKVIISSVGASIACYNANKEYIKAVSTSGAFTGNFIVPDGVYYIVLSNYGTGEKYAYSAPTYNLENIEEKVEYLTAETIKLKPVLKYSGYILYNTGIATSSPYGKYTDRVDIRNYDSIRWNTANGPDVVARVAFYNANNEYMKSVSVNEGKGGVIDLTDAAYSNVKYAVFSYYNRSSADFSGYDSAIFKSNGIPQQIYNLTQKVNEMNKFVWNEHPVNLLIFGDSITDCASFTIENDKTTAYNMLGTNTYVDGEGHTIRYKMWPKLFGEFFPCAEIRNYARSGASYKDKSNPADPRQNLSYQITLAINDLDNPNGAFLVDNFNPNVIIFALGTNDGLPNDTPADAYAKIVTDTSGIDIDATLSILDRSKFCESVLWAYFTVRKHFPFALILCELPIQRMSNDCPIGNARTYLMEIAQRYGGAVIVDGAYESGIVKENNVVSGLGATLKDGLHPNEKGQNMLARLFIGKTRSYYLPFNDMN